MKNDNIHSFFLLFWLQILNLPASLQNKNTRVGPFPWKRSVLQNPDRERTNQSTGICLRLGLPYNKYMLLTKREVKMPEYWPSSLLAFSWTETKSRSIKTQLYGIRRLHVALLFCLCVCRFLLLNVFLKLFNSFVFFVFILVHALGFLVFSFHPDRKITENLFTVTENVCERKFSCTRLDFGEILFREQNGQSRADSVAPSCPLG